MNLPSLLHRVLFFFFLSWLAGVVDLRGSEKDIVIKPRPLRENESLPTPRREFRAAWVATVANIDWPSKPTLPVAKQKEEALAILDRLVELNLNAVIFQVRPQADAMYQSDLEPWSYFLTGKQGKAPEPFWDPLAFWVEEAHARGLQLHAWFNPYRANHGSHSGPIHETSIVKTNPDLVVKLGDKGIWWLDPAIEEASEHSLKVILDVVKRYDIDGVHLDDYFYPYPSYNNDRDFPDEVSYSFYTEEGGELEIPEWRRKSVNDFVRKLSREIKKEKAHVEFGISPFGIWRPGNPDEDITGLDQFEVLHADAKLWLNQGWTDYFMPQLYWPIASKGQSFPVLLGWWKDENRKGRHLWPGLRVTKPEDSAKATELINQIMCTRGICRENPGVCLFRTKWLMKKSTRGTKALYYGPWSKKALIPASPWIDDNPPARPILLLAENCETINSPHLSIKAVDSSDGFLFVINEKINEKWSAAEIVTGTEHLHKIRKGVSAIAVRTVDRSRNLSVPEIIEIEYPEEK